jgi:predicted RNase H-like nuclease (RuvC/YqgF family)
MFNFLKKYEVLEDDTSIYEEIQILNKKIKSLEVENTELTNTIYELENKIDMIISEIKPHTYNLKKFSLGE